MRILKPTRKGKGRRGDRPCWLEPTFGIEQLERELMGQMEGSVEDLCVCLLRHSQAWGDFVPKKIPPQKHRTSLGPIASHFFNNGPRTDSDGWAGCRDSQHV